MDEQETVEKENLNTNVEAPTKKKIIELCRATKRNQGNVIDRAVEIAFPVMLAEVKSVSTLVNQE